jgi:hypothetical protein
VARRTAALSGRGERMRASCPLERVVGRRQSDSIVLQEVSRTQLPRLAAVPHSMTWSARPSTDGGIVRPSAFAVLRLMTSSNFVGCSTGNSPGFAPLRILST